MGEKKNKIKFVLVSTRSPGNIGSSARVLKNFGFQNLYLVDPHFHKKRDEEEGETYFEKETKRMAYKSFDILEKARLFNSFEEAVSECSLIFGTDPNPPQYSRIVYPEEAAEIIARENSETAIVFGTESDGMSKREISFCSYIIKIPTVETFVDLNLSHSLAIVAYSIYRKVNNTKISSDEEKPTIKLLEELTDDFLDIGVKSEFLREKDSDIANEFRNIFIKDSLTLRSAGILRSFAKRVRSKLIKSS
ncbi:MAG: RNA methyltransferase [Thermoanaerobaculaceae bacterium]|nr:RNA methyltransferase [Thermoanaerobaculaceae bacterium]